MTFGGGELSSAASNSRDGSASAPGESVGGDSIGSADGDKAGVGGSVLFCTTGSSNEISSDALGDSASRDSVGPSGVITGVSIPPNPSENSDGASVNCKAGSNDCTSLSVCSGEA